MATRTKVPSDDRFLVEEARRQDPDRFLCAIFAPAEYRSLILGLILFNHELARVPEIASEPMLGMIRYQWWRDALKEAAEGRPRRHPVVEVLSNALAAGLVDRASLEALIDARETEIDRLQPEDLDQLEAFVAATSGHLNVMIERAITGGRWQQAARHAGTAYGLVGIVRAAEAYASQGRMLVPQGLTTTPILDRASTQLGQMKIAAAGAPSRASAALLQGSIARRQIKVLRNAAHSGAVPLKRGPLLPSELFARSLLAFY